MESMPRNHVRKIIEAFLRQVQQTKNKNSYNNLTSAPISKCSVRENMPWLQVGLKGTRECHGYTTLGEMIRRLDFTGSAFLTYRFPYILQVIYLLVKREMTTLSATAQQHLFQVIEVLLSQVMESKRGIRQMHYILNTLMSVLQIQSKKKMISSKATWFKKLDTVRRWQSQLKQIDVPYRMDSHATLSDMPVEVQAFIVSCLTDHEDIRSLSCVNRTLNEICENTVVWRNLCHANFTKFQVTKAKNMYFKQLKKKAKSENKDNISNLIKPDSVRYWKAIHEILLKSFKPIEENYIDPLLYCKHCSVLFWKETGHPCIQEFKDIVPNIDHLSPQQVVSFFEPKR
uniref:F-box only protein 32-like n=1 Tax=Phallusia mammillata TaxID=59560 RepID=A0A6F9DBZ6_9ASCI|nr:F-box only protein 32-like [Phallusia mammillata]